MTLMDIELVLNVYCWRNKGIKERERWGLNSTGPCAILPKCSNLSILNS